MLPGMRSVLGFHVPKRNLNANKLYPLATGSWSSLLPVLPPQNHRTASLHRSGGWKDAAGY